MQNPRKSIEIKKKKYCSHFFRLEQHKQNYLQKLILKAKESSVEDTKKIEKLRNNHCVSQIKHKRTNEDIKEAAQTVSMNENEPTFKNKSNKSLFT